MPAQYVILQTHTLCDLVLPVFARTCDYVLSSPACKFEHPDNAPLDLTGGYAILPEPRNV